MDTAISRNPERYRKLIEKVLATPDKESVGKYSITPELEPFFTNGHVLLMGPALNYLFSDRKAYTTGPTIEKVIPEFTALTQETTLPDALPIQVEKKSTVTAVFNSELAGLKMEDSRIGETLEDGKHIGFNLNYIKFLLELGFNKLIWSNAASPAIAYRQTGDDIDNDLTAVIMPMRLEKLS